MGFVHVKANSGGGAGDGSPTSPLLRKIGSFLSLETEDLDALRRLEERSVALDADREIIAEGEAYDKLYVIREGWAIRYKTLRDGRRQIANFVLPGDFVCLNAVLFPRSHYAISTITPVVASPFDPALFRELIDRRPRLGLAVAWCNAREEAMLLEHLTSLGRRSAYERIAHLIMELWRRLEILDLTDGGRFAMPLTQEEIGDCMGLSVVHVSRTLQRLRRDGLIRVGDGAKTMTVRDMEGLTRAAGFDEGYLYFTESLRQGVG